MKTKSFDCVEMMHKGAKRIHDATGKMSRKAELAYWQAREKELLSTAFSGAHQTSAVRESHSIYRISR